MNHFSLNPKAAPKRHQWQEASQGRFKNWAAKNRGLPGDFWIKILLWERMCHMAVWCCSLLSVSRASKAGLAQTVLDSRTCCGGAAGALRGDSPCLSEDLLCYHPLNDCRHFPSERHSWEDKNLNLRHFSCVSPSSKIKGNSPQWDNVFTSI